MRLGLSYGLQALVAFLLLAGSASAQTANQPTEPIIDPLTGKPVEIGEVYDVEFVLVPVAIRGGKAGERLPRENFTLKVDGRPVAIETFESDESAPLSIVFLQDLSGSMAEPGKMEASREALDCFLDTANPADEKALATFSGGRTQIDVPLTRDISVVRESMELWEPWGTTGLYDAVAMLPEISVGSGGAKRAAVLVTDGIDNASQLTPAEAAAFVQSAALPVFVLALPGRADVPEDEQYRYADLLQELAAATGGQYYALAGPEEARRTCSVILRELRFQYVLGFSVSGTGPDTYHRIAVDVRGRGRRTTLIHRRGYRGTAPSRPRATP